LIFIYARKYFLFLPDAKEIYVTTSPEMQIDDILWVVTRIFLICSKEESLLPPIPQQRMSMATIHVDFRNI
jgi:hypothetical protein